MNIGFSKLISVTLRRVGFEIRGVKFEDTSHTFDHTFERLLSVRNLGFYPSYIYDIGASNGSWTKRALHVFPESSFLCVEPLIENQAALQEISATYSNVQYWQGCLGSHSEKSILYTDGDGSSLLRGHWGNTYGEETEVEVETLNNLIKKLSISPPDLLKLDVQGFELEILKSAGDHIDEIQAIIAETSIFRFQEGMPLCQEIISYLSDHAFVLYDLLRMAVRPYDQALGQLDLLFVKESHSLMDNNRWAKNSIY